MVGLGADTDSVGAPIDGIWSATKDRKLKHWFDELLDYAEALTDETWEWHVENGTLFFNEAESAFGEAPLLSYETNLITVDRADVEESGSDRLNLEAMLDPRISKGQEVVLETDRFSGVYKVVSYSFDSTSGGTHTMSATVERMDDVERRDRRVLEPLDVSDEFVPSLGGL